MTSSEISQKDDSLVLIQQLKQLVQEGKVTFSVVRQHLGMDLTDSDIESALKKHSNSCGLKVEEIEEGKKVIVYCGEGTRATGSSSDSKATTTSESNNNTSNSKSDSDSKVTVNKDQNGPSSSIVNDINNAKSTVVRSLNFSSSDRDRSGTPTRGRKVSPRNNESYRKTSPPKRDCVMIREVPDEVTHQDLVTLLTTTLEALDPSKPPISNLAHMVREIRKDVNKTWFITFRDEGKAFNCARALQRTEVPWGKKNINESKKEKENDGSKSEGNGFKELIRCGLKSTIQYKPEESLSRTNQNPGGNYVQQPGNNNGNSNNQYYHNNRSCSRNSRLSDISSSYDGGLPDSFLMQNQFPNFCQMQGQQHLMLNQQQFNANGNLNDFQSNNDQLSPSAQKLMTQLNAGSTGASATPSTQAGSPDVTARRLSLPSESDDKPKFNDNDNDSNVANSKSTFWKDLNIQRQRRKSENDAGKTSGVNEFNRRSSQIPTMQRYNKNAFYSIIQSYSIAHQTPTTTPQMPPGFQLFTQLRPEESKHIFKKDFPKLEETFVYFGASVGHVKEEKNKEGVSKKEDLNTE